MSKGLALLLVASLLVGTNTNKPAEGKAQKEPGNTTVVVADDVLITILPEVKISIRPVQTGEGTRVRLETPNVAIEAVRLRVESNGQVTEIQICKDGLLDIRTNPKKR